MLMTSKTKRLEVFQDLSLSGPASSRRALRKALLKHTAPPWRHAEETENQLPTGTESESDILAFDRDASDSLPAATLFLWGRPDGYKVSNIVPLQIGELGYRKYNAILKDFERRIAAPAAEQAAFEVKTTAALQSIDDWMRPKVASALRRFSAAANKSTGSSHPADRKRWLEFLVEAHAARIRLGADELARWLTEIEGWDDGHAFTLAVEYEFALELLSEYDRHRLS